MSNKRYICIGENFRDDTRIGYCGDIHTIDEWIRLLYPNNTEQALEFFNGDTEASIVKYLLTNKGKRLTRF
jgi:hypothetical protein